MRFEDVLNDLVNNGYTIIAVLSNDDPYKRSVVVQDSNGNKITKNYVLTGFDEVKDSNGNVTGIEEDWQEV